MTINDDNDEVQPGAGFPLVGFSMGGPGGPPSGPPYILPLGGARRGHKIFGGGAMGGPRGFDGGAWGGQKILSPQID